MRRMPIHRQIRLKYFLALALVAADDGILGERSTKVSLKKDILQTPWSTAIHHDAVYMVKKDKVLMPSHFTLKKTSIDRFLRFGQ